MSFLSRLSTLSIAATAIAGLPAAAATVTEGAEFSSNWTAPTEIAAGTNQVSGVAGDLDVLKLTGLATGVQTLSFSFSGAASYTGGNMSAGGTILYSYTPFEWGWDQDGQTTYSVNYNEWNVGTPWYGSTGSLTSLASLTLNSAFDGTLYLAIVPTYGAPLSYTIGVPVAEVSAVPLPAGAALLAGAMAGLAGLGFGRRKRA